MADKKTERGRWDVVLVVVLGIGAVLMYARVPGLAMGMLAAAVVVALVSAAARGGSSSRRTRELESENAELRTRLTEMEERLANVETISRFEMQLAAREDGQLGQGEHAERSERSEQEPGSRL
ncbi:hypothetical protein BH23VER1_BH23VER1_02960 [soil metagenome]